MLLSNTQFFIVLGLGAAGVYAARNKAGAVVGTVNPASPDNLVNQAAQSVVGVDRLQNGFDKLFATVDRWNPLASESRKRYAEQVLLQ